MIDSLDFDFLIRLLINMVGIFVLVRLIYFRATKQRAYASSYILFGLGVFLITSQLASVEISMGFAFGLFAIFSMLRSQGDFGSSFLLLNWRSSAIASPTRAN